MNHTIYKSVLILVLLLAPLSIYPAITDVTPQAGWITDLYLRGTEVKDELLLEILDSLILSGELPADRHWMCVFLTADDVDATGLTTGCCDVGSRFSIARARDYFMQRNWVNYRKGVCELGR